MSRKIGFNVVLAFPWCLGCGGLNRAIAIADAAGYDGLQILPMRGWSDDDLKDIDPKRIIAIEDAWNCGPLFKALARQSGWIGEPAPTIFDWLLFGSSCCAIDRRMKSMRRHFPVAIHSARDYDQSGPIEMHPEIDMTIKQYANYPYGIVWDTGHILRPGRHGEMPVTDDWRKLFERVSYNIRLIHIKAGADPEMLKMLDRATDCPVILEIMPPMSVAFRQRALIGWLRDRYCFLRGYFY